MFAPTSAFSSFAVSDLDRARRFYEEVLGLRTSSGEQGTLVLHLPGDTRVIVYAKPDFVAATFTVLNFQVDDIDAAVGELNRRGVQLDRYPGFDQDQLGIFRGAAIGRGPDIGWFRDPAGNIIAVLKG
jgi:predicted enzyme related to lactoylglutathione lyase